MPEPDRSLLLEAFADFYQEVARVKLRAADGRLPAYLAGNGRGGEATPETLAAQLRVRLKNRLDRQQRTFLRRATDEERRAYETARYVMAALVDELLIFDVDWPGAKIWPRCLLERALFGSAMAGSRVFTLIDDLLARRAYGPQHEDLAAVFLMALQLGLRGRYRGASGRSALQRYRERLLELLGTDAGATGAAPACPQAYDYLIAEPGERRLAPMGRWYRIGAAALAVWLVASTVVWLASVGRLDQVLGVS